MRFTRLIIDADQTQVSLALHPRLTVIAGVGGPVRDLLARELIGSLHGDHSGVNVEVADDRGRMLAVLRPRDGAHRVVDVDEAVDVSEELRGPDGRIDLLAHHGLDGRRAAELLRFDRQSLQAGAGPEEDVLRLAELNQTELWSTAARVRITLDELNSLNEDLEVSSEDADLVSRIEKRHHTLEAALEYHRELRRQTALVAATSLLLALPVAYIDPGRAVPILAIGLLTVVLTFLYRARVEAAQRMEANALADAGVDSYLDFMVQRVDGMLAGTEQRRRLLAVAEDHRNAAVRWTRLAGDVNVDWAMAHHDEIEATSRLRRQLHAAGGAGCRLDEEVVDLAQRVNAHLTRLRTVGRGQESFPLILDDPFTDQPPAVRRTMLELLARQAGSPQVILMSDQPDVADWARLEALTGGVSLVEPHAEPAEARRSQAG